MDNQKRKCVPVVGMDKGIKKKKEILTYQKEIVNKNIVDTLPLLPCPGEKEMTNLEKDTTILINNNILFPNLIWKSVIGNITDPEDIENCSNASLYFKNLLKDKIETDVLLPKVFEIMFQKYQHSTTEAYTETNLDSIPWKISTGNLAHKLTGFWKMRLVCKSWNKAFEDFHQNESIGQFNTSYDTARNMCVKPWAELTFDNAEITPSNFLKHFDETHYNFGENKLLKNPFLGRHIRFMITSSTFNHLNDFDELQGRYGSEIWYCEFQYLYQPSLDTLVPFYNFLQQSLGHMPNLKTLRVQYKYRHVDNERFHDRNPSGEELQELEQAVSINSLPELPYLEFLSTRFLPTPIFNELISTYNNVTDLEVRRKEWHGDYEIFSEHLENLSKLSIDFCSVLDFEKFVQYPARLELDELHFIYQSSQQFLKWSKIFDAIGISFCETLKELVIKMPEAKTETEKLSALEDSFRCRLNLPELETFDMLEQANVFCLDFLLPTKNCLNTLTLHTSDQAEIPNSSELSKMEREYKNTQVIQYLGFRGKIDESNIRQVFRSLKYVHFH